MNKKSIKKIIRFLIPNFLQNIIKEGLMIDVSNLRSQTICYSQEGEDLILEALLEGQNTGFYVDIGSYHPVVFSNTYLFYQKGWTGLNIDARPGSKHLFDELRDRDINLEIGVSLEEGELTYYMFDEPGLNGFSQSLSEQRINETKYQLIGTTQLKTRPLGKILSEYLPKGCVIDFMSIDVEGYDLEVLKSNDWENYIPKFILAETSVVDQKKEDNTIDLFLLSKGYSKIANTTRTAIYQQK